MGWSRVRQVNRLESAGEAWRFIQHVSMERGVWACMCVCTCKLKFGTSGQSYASKVAPSVAVILPSVCCHFLSCPYQPPHFFLSQTEVWLHFLSFTRVCITFPLLLCLQMICTPIITYRMGHLFHFLLPAFASSFILFLSYILLSL